MEGDTLNRQTLESLTNKSRSNLLNTALFNFVDINFNIDTTKLKTDTEVGAVVVVKVVERWYTWPFPVVMINERNFNTWWETRDFDEVTYGFIIQQNNFRGRREKLHLTLMRGYNQSVGITYENPNFNKKKTIGLTLSCFYTQNHSSAYASYDNEQLSVKIKDSYVKKNFNARLMMIFRPQIHYYHYLSLVYQRFDFSDTLSKLNYFYTYPGIDHPDYFVLNYRLKADFRDYQSYPLEGSFYDIEIEKTGLSYNENDFPDYLTAKTSLRKYIRINERYFYAASLTGKYSFGKNPPYFLQKGLGFDNDFVRGLEYYVVDGQEYLLFRNNLKWNLLPKRIKEIPFLHNQKFSLIHYALYLNAFTDMAYVSDQNVFNVNKLADRWIAGYGIGLDLVTYYDKVFRFEFSRNQLGENGLYLHFVAPI